MELLRIWQRDRLDDRVRHALDRRGGVPLDARRRHVAAARPDRGRRSTIDLPQPRTAMTREDPRFFELVTAVREALAHGHGRRVETLAAGERMSAAAVEPPARRAARGVGARRRLAAGAARLRARHRRLGVGLLPARRQVPAAEAVRDRERVLGQPPRALARRLVHVQGGARRVRRSARRSAILVALMLARWRRLGHALMPYAIAASAVPIIAFAPITNAWFGVLNPHSKMAIAGDPLLLPGAREHAARPDVGAAGVDRADALLRRERGRHLPPRALPDRAAATSSRGSRSRPCSR